jgi:hypothetical protein
VSERENNTDSLIPPGLGPVELHLVAIAQSLVRLEGKVDKALDAHVAVAKVTDDHETRIRALEQSKWKVMGVVAGISAAVSTAVVIAKNSGVIPL